jgi:YbgC/YbaW family acyl-CoA thioester hydrolase
MPFRLRRLVEFADTDMAGIVHFANFFRYAEAAEHAYLRACGLSVFGGWEGLKITFPRVSAACDYLKPLRFEEEVEVAVTVERIGRTSVHYAFEFSRGDEAIARGRLTTVLCRVLEDGRLEAYEFPAALRERLLAGPDGQ